jgi:ornithine cyclodeaminase
MEYRILTDEDIFRLFDMKAVIAIMEESFRQKAVGNLTYPPRISVAGQKGSLVFTVGESPAQASGLGFRVYSQFQGATVKNNHLVAVFDSNTGFFKGAVIGTAIGDLRTGAINGVAVKYLARADSRVLGVIGTGVQAVTQVQAAVAVHDFHDILVHSRDAGRRKGFAQSMATKLDRAVRAVESSREVVEAADVLLCCTTSPAPVFNPDWVKPGTHINTIGPKLQHRHELPPQAAIESDLIVTDTLVQIEDMGERHFLHGHIPLERYIPLSDIVTGNHPGRSEADQQTLFCSNGLAGTEVAFAAEALKLHDREVQYQEM